MGGEELDLQASSTVSLLLMAVGITVLLEASPLFLPGSVLVEVASPSGTKAASPPVIFHWTVVWGPHPDPYTTTTLAGVAAPSSCFCGYCHCPSPIPLPLCIPI